MDSLLEALQSGAAFRDRRKEHQGLKVNILFTFFFFFLNKAKIIMETFKEVLIFLCF
uniref:DAD domain-containing protein n=1 Tax=Meleagris gallopavo TaxID=9103 RepID=A0A803Y6B9_MELGA